MAFNKIPTENDVTDLDEDFFDELQDNIEKAFDDSVNGTVLYENSSGATESFELDVDSTEYSFADIYISRNTGILGKQIIRVKLPSTGAFPLGFIDNDGATTSIYHARVTISGKQVTIIGNANGVNLTNNSITTTQNKLAIYKIVGFK